MIRNNQYDPIVTALVCAFAWAVPGGGHFWLGQWRKGADILLNAWKDAFAKYDNCAIS